MSPWFYSMHDVKFHPGEVFHFEWVDRKLKPKDVLTVKVITAARVDEPRRRIAEDPQAVERSQRRYYQRLKRKFEKPRKK